MLGLGRLQNDFGLLDNIWECDRKDRYASGMDQESDYYDTPGKLQMSFGNCNTYTCYCVALSEPDFNINDVQRVRSFNWFLSLGITLTFLFM